MARIWTLFVVLLALALPRAASAQGTGSFVSPGPLSRAHAELDTLTGCPQCHQVFGHGPDPARCLACHDSVKDQVANRQGFHADKATGCGSAQCHPDHRGREFALIRLDESSFDHDKTGFPLEGAHARTRCIGCHTKPNDFTGLSQTCASCHDDPHGADQSKRDLLGACEKCHDADDWKALPVPTAVFDHEAKADTDYVLEGMHRQVDCEACHVEMVFVPLEFELCSSCHVNPHRAPFREKPCEDCHPGPETWEVARFDHDLTRYALEGKHVDVGCVECHRGDKTAPLPFADCTPCHTDVHRGQFAPKPCGDCHTVSGFSMREFDHSRTDFPLRGKHALNTCEQCHGQGDQARYVDLRHDDCDACHEDVHQGRFQPTNCKACHVEDGFGVQVFDHDDTDFPHTGKHVGLDCNKCHRDFQWNGIPHGSCQDCHYTKNPHRPVITPDTCDGCHTTQAFDILAFDHAKETGFDLSPQHVENKCTECHTYIYQFDGLDKACTSCHEDDRPFGHYPGLCGDCHQAADWFPGGLGGNDHAITGFRLAATHSLLPCESCHAPGVPRGDAKPSCGQCHWADDPHKNQLGVACQDCHNEVSWLRTTFRHTITGWPLRGAHRLAACIDCHAQSYVATPTECARCHEAEAPTTIPAHRTPAFLTCDYCHRPYSWDAPGYPH